MIGRFKFEILSKYPHLTETEGGIWTRFIQKYPKYFDSVDYDIPVGNFRGNIEDLKEEWQRNAGYLGKYKIDCVGYKGDVITIVEVKKEATTKALGEIWLYEFLYKKDKMPVERVDCLILTDYEMPNMSEICQSDNVKIIIV